MELHEIIAMLRNMVCFDALEDDAQYVERRKTHPLATGRCEHHGGKCTQILERMHKIERELIGEPQDAEIRQAFDNMMGNPMDAIAELKNILRPSN